MFRRAARERRQAACVAVRRAGRRLAVPERRSVNAPADSPGSSPPEPPWSPFEASRRFRNHQFRDAGPHTSRGPLPGPNALVPIIVAPRFLRRRAGGGRSAKATATIVTVVLHRNGRGETPNAVYVSSQSAQEKNTAVALFSAAGGSVTGGPRRMACGRQLFCPKNDPRARSSLVPGSSAYSTPPLWSTTPTAPPPATGEPAAATPACRRFGKSYHRSAAPAGRRAGSPARTASTAAPTTGWRVSRGGRCPPDSAGRR